MSFQIWLGFVLACWIISISPGAGAIASMSSGLNYGFRHGYWNALGLQLALLVQIGIVAAGVGVLFATTPWAFWAVKWFGVAYLLYLAYLQWMAPIQSIEIQQEQPTKLALQIGDVWLFGQYEQSQSNRIFTWQFYRNFWICLNRSGVNMR